MGKSSKDKRGMKFIYFIFINKMNIELKCSIKIIIIYNIK